MDSLNWPLTDPIRSNNAQVTISRRECVVGLDSAKLVDMEKIPTWDRSALLRMPAFEPLHHWIARTEDAAFPSLTTLNCLFNEQRPAIHTHSGHPVRMVPQEYGKLPIERQYEPRCYLQGEVPTREHNWHDLLNALVWLAFPGAKAAINLRHYRAQMVERYAGPSASQRGVVRDMNTLFDESGVVVPCADAALAESLREFRWKDLFWQRRPQVRRSMGFYLFGHGLYEKALNPYIGMTGQGLLLSVEQEFFDWPLTQRLAHLDKLLAEYLGSTQHCRDTRELTPVPLLGVPGWTNENETEAYYENTDYFRTGRNGNAKKQHYV